MVLIEEIVEEGATGGEHAAGQGPAAIDAASDIMVIDTPSSFSGVNMMLPIYYASLFTLMFPIGHASRFTVMLPIDSYASRSTVMLPIDSYASRSTVMLPIDSYGSRYNEVFPVDSYGSRSIHMFPIGSSPFRNDQIVPMAKEVCTQDLHLKYGELGHPSPAPLLLEEPQATVVADPAEDPNVAEPDDDGFTVVRSRRYGMVRGMYPEGPYVEPAVHTCENEVPWQPKAGPLRKTKQWSQARKGGSAGQGFFVYGSYGPNNLEF